MNTGKSGNSQFSSQTGFQQSPRLPGNSRVTAHEHNKSLIQCVESGRQTDVPPVSTTAISKREGSQPGSCQLRAANLKLAYITTEVRKDYPESVDIEINSKKKLGADRFLRVNNSDNSKQCGKNFINVRDILVYGEARYQKKIREKYRYFLGQIRGLKGQALNSELFALETGKRLSDAGAKVVEIIKITSSSTQRLLIKREHFVVAIDRESSDTKSYVFNNSQPGKAESTDVFETGSPASFSEASVICDTRLKIFCPAKEYVELVKDSLPSLLDQTIGTDDMQWESVYCFQETKSSGLATLVNFVKRAFDSNSQ